MKVRINFWPFSFNQNNEEMKKRYELEDKVKIIPGTLYEGQNGGTIGKIIDFEYELPDNDDEITDDYHYYNVEWGNGDTNCYRYIDLMLAEKEKSLKEQAVERFGHISTSDKFTVIDLESDNIIKETLPENWTENGNCLFLAEYGNGGLCIHNNGEWSERASLPVNWMVKCENNSDDQPELKDWRMNASNTKSDWYSKGMIDYNGHWWSYTFKDRGIITYDQFIKWVYNPWKNKQTPPVIQKEATKFNVGDVVRVIAETSGWGAVKYGDIGIVRSVDHFRGDDNYIVDFPSQSSWSGHSSCFSLVEYNSVQDEIVYSPFKVIIENTPLVRVITTNGISSEFKNEQSINLSIYKPKKVKQLKL
jgi:hypothetical protein